MTYSEKLRDPRWQKKRLEILSRDKFTCLNCGNNQSELQVHHIKYINGLEPWEYEDELLRTLCANCHTTCTQTKKEIKAIIDECFVYDEQLSMLHGILCDIHHLSVGELFDMSKVICKYEKKILKKRNG